MTDDVPINFTKKSFAFSFTDYSGWQDCAIQADGDFIIIELHHQEHKVVLVVGKTLVREIFRIKGKISRSRKLKKFSKAEAYNVGKGGERLRVD